MPKIKEKTIETRQDWLADPTAELFSMLHEEVRFSLHKLTH